MHFDLKQSLVKRYPSDLENHDSFHYVHEILIQGERCIVALGLLANSTCVIVETEWDLDSSHLVKGESTKYGGSVVYLLRP